MLRDHRSRQARDNVHIRVQWASCILPGEVLLKHLNPWWRNHSHKLKKDVCCPAQQAALQRHMSAAQDRVRNNAIQVYMLQRLAFEAAQPPSGFSMACIGLMVHW